ncbi:hypothetical protein A3D70_01960 [Candidatus Adlerbacteria bacterium RIFCSPHIGHO2_02_FULL_54_18]|uniref:Metallopeptidase family protein n=2 Tax=Candidatus Adleribacteriota TaxID=1752736 RepID=A0A1F4Y1W6_9BACT|nr:MAG: hypothetical protein A2949_02470 [Candidatus Adlerbacteria bacterium RIFCSPLOWO2_01_FULL_54_21b]OGC87970.1 MAG: hypothetical protein A3D70_01960 [Candidatus Adlerbacteria bacterium RIFCSPHIGHO2_02_FULL_54_18]
MTREEFEKAVEQEFPNAVPKKFRPLIKNCAFLVENEPGTEVREREGLGAGETLLGYYHGIPHTARGDTYGVGMTLPDSITLYQLPIEEAAHQDGISVEQVIRETIWHEVAHHFGFDEHQVREREERRDAL